MQLNVLYKIISWRVILKVNNVLDYLISDKQTGCLKYRYLKETLDMFIM